MNRPLRFADLGEAWLDAVRSWVGLDKSVVASGQRSVGQRLVVDVEIATGRLTGRFRRAESEANEMVLSFAPFDAQRRATVDSVVATRAQFLGDLLFDTIGVELDAALQQAGIDLLPGSTGLTFECSCTEDSPCRHVVALAVAAGPIIAREPAHLLTLWGHGVDAILHNHRARRAPSGSDAIEVDAASAERTGTIDPARLPSTVGALPRIPAAASQSGEPAGWPRREPPESIDVEALDELARDAIERAWAMSTGDADSRLALPIDVDLARRAVGHVGSSRIIELAKMIDVTGPRVIALATAWETAGAAGLDLLDAPPWFPEAALLEEAKQLIIESGRRESSIKTEANTITVAEKWQYRFGQDHQWYRFDLRSGHWHLFVPPAADISDVLARKKK